MRNLLTSQRNLFKGSTGKRLAPFEELLRLDKPAPGCLTSESMNDLGPWHTEDFETLSWHDVHVHGLWLDSYVTDEGTADLILDIDYILEWRESEGNLLFAVCQAELRFHKISGLRICLDYAVPRAGMAPFSMDGIEREPLVFPTGYESYRWRIPVNWPDGLIELESPGFTQALVGSPAVQAEQWLNPVKRNSRNSGVV